MVSTNQTKKMVSEGTMSDVFFYTLCNPAYHLSHIQISNTITSSSYYL